MPTPIGHGLAGAIIYALSTRRSDFLRRWRWLAACVLFAALPDIDFLPALFGELDTANRIHRHLTHTLLSSAALSAAAWGVLRALGKPRPLWHSLVVFSCLSGHIFLDLLSKDSRPPEGIAFLWPFVGKRLKIPAEIFPDLHKETYEEIFSLYSVRVVGYEVAVFGSLLLAVIVLKLLLWPRGQPAAGAKGLSINCRRADTPSAAAQRSGETGDEVY